MIINTIIIMIVIVIAMISIISSRTTWNRLLGLKEEEEGDYDDVYGDYDPDAELL